MLYDNIPEIMTQKYANEQPNGFVNIIERVAIVGVSIMNGKTGPDMILTKV